MENTDPRTEWLQRLVDESRKLGGDDGSTSATITASTGVDNNNEDKQDDPRTIYERILRDAWRAV